MPLASARALVFATSADYARYTGGFVYNERLVTGLAQAGWRIERLLLPAGFPRPTERAVALTGQAFERLARGSTVLIDQLCLSVLPEIAREQGSRLRLAAIVHHPLAREHGPGALDDREVAAMERAALAHATWVIVTSMRTLTAMASDYGIARERLILAPPGVDRLERAIGSGSGATSLLTVGAVVPRKAHELLIDALAGLTDRPWRLTIVGDLDRAPSHVDAIRTRILARGMADRVTLAGALDGDAMARAWREADIFTAASHHEGFGMATAEAIARGLPVVTTNAGAVADWLDPRASIIVPNGDAAALRDALARLLDDPSLRRELANGANDARSSLPQWAKTAEIVDSALRALCP